MRKILILFLFAHCSLLIENCLCQWQPDTRLTNNTATSYTSFNNAWCIASGGNIVHVVWQERRDGNDEIYYKRSTDGGTSWGADTRLTNEPERSEFPCIAVSGSVVHLIWQDWRVGNPRIYYKRSMDGGTSWGADVQLTTNNGTSELSSVTVLGQTVHVVWDDQRDGHNEIYYKNSTNGGDTWGSDIRLTNIVSNKTHPSVSVYATTVHIVWEDSRDGNIEVYYKRSTDGGTIWGADIRLTNNSSSSHNPSIAVSGLTVHVVWYDRRDGTDEIYYKRSTDGGLTWGTDTRLSSLPLGGCFRPSIASSGIAVHIVWYAGPGFEESEIYYKRSFDGGVNWNADLRLTNSTGESSFSSICLSGGLVHVVWQDERDGNTEVYYKRNPTGNVNAVNIIGSEIPRQFSLFQNYPNPFNPMTNIKFQIPNEGFVQLKIFDMLGREIETLVNENLRAGTYRVDFDGNKYASGIYFYRITSGDFTDVRKMILVK